MEASAASPGAGSSESPNLKPRPSQTLQAPVSALSCLCLYQMCLYIPPRGVRGAGSSPGFGPMVAIYTHSPTPAGLCVLSTPPRRVWTVYSFSKGQFRHPVLSPKAKHTNAPTHPTALVSEEPRSKGML